MTTSTAVSTRATALISSCAPALSMPGAPSGPRRDARRPRIGPRTFTNASRVGSGLVARAGPVAVHESPQVQVGISRAWLMKRQLARPCPQPGSTRNSTGGTLWTRRRCPGAKGSVRASFPRFCPQPARTNSAAGAFSPERRGPASANASRARALTHGHNARTANGGRGPFPQPAPVLAAPKQMNQPRAARASTDATTSGRRSAQRAALDSNGTLAAGWANLSPRYVPVWERRPGRMSD